MNRPFFHIIHGKDTLKNKVKFEDSTLANYAFKGHP